MKIIESELGVVISAEKSHNLSTALINRIVLDNTKIQNLLNWKPKYSIEDGIRETIRRKKTILGKPVISAEKPEPDIFPRGAS